MAAEFYSGREALSRELLTLASSLADNSSRSLILERRKNLQESLSSLSSLKHIHAAYLFDVEGKPQAEYLNRRDSDFVLDMIRHDFKDIKEGDSLPAQTTQVFDLRHISCFMPVTYKDRQAGTIYLLSDLDPIHARFRVFVSGLLLAFVFLLAASWVMARMIQKPLSSPLMQLADVMRRVASSSSYSLRAQKVSNDEVGLLVEVFNRMLGQIESQQSRLLKHQEILEKTVNERTAELRRTVTALDKARRQADSANEAKSDFLSKMTHELRTPLIGVLGMNELLQRTGLDEQQQLLTDTVEKSGRQLLDQISDILDIARIEAGKIELESDRVSLYRIVEDVAYLLAPNARKKGLVLLTDIPVDATWDVVADEGRIRQILMNLIGNAIRYTDRGLIEVSLTCQVSDKAAGLFRLSVRDTGAGIDDDVKERIFESFYQPGTAQTRKQSGSGLGLAIVKQLVELMQGTLTLHSETGQGSVFDVCLPLKLAGRNERLFESPGTDGSIVLVGHDASVLALLAKRFRERGVEVFVATAAHQFYQHVHACRRQNCAPLVLYDASLYDQVYQMRREHKEPFALLQDGVRLIYDVQDDIYEADYCPTMLAAPVRWEDILQVQVRSAEISSAVSAFDAIQPDESPILLLGQHIASCELSRLLLSQGGFSTRVCRTFEELPNPGSSGCKPILLVDCPWHCEGDLSAYLQHHRHDYGEIFLLRNAPVGGSLTEFSTLKKPLTEESLVQISQILSAGRGDAMAGAS